MVSLSYRTIVVPAILALSLVAVSAQPVRPGKTGDKLTLDIIRFEERGRELLPSSTPATADFERSGNGHTLTYSTGRIETYDADHSLVELTSRGRVETFEGQRRFKWMPGDRNYKTPRQVKDLYTSSVCGETEATYEVVPQESRYQIVVDGKPVEAMAIEFKMQGRWVAPCGSGKVNRRIVFSPDLDLVLESETLIYNPKGFLFSGFGSRVKSVN